MTRGVQHWCFSGCRHADALLVENRNPVVAHADRTAIETRWDAEAQRLFDVYTAGWADSARETFKARIWPTPPPVIPTELFDAHNQPVKPADIAAVKKWNEAHPGRDEDDGGYI